MYDIRQSKNFALFTKSQNWEIIFHNKNYFFLKKLFFFGYFVKLQRPNNINLNEIQEILKDKKIFRVLIEPKNKEQADLLIKNNFSKTSPYTPSKTLIVNLKKSQKEILSNMRKTTRNIINNKVSKINIKEINSDEEIIFFRKKWRNAVSFKHYVPSHRKLINLKKIFNKNALFLETEFGGGIFLKSGNKTYYWHGFANQKGKKNFHPYKILWAGILWGKQNKSQFFDFEGIYDERNKIKSWIGFSNFKKGFGGEEFEWPNSFITKTSKFTIFT